jgi:hypothetical protein
MDELIPERACELLGTPEEIAREIAQHRRDEEFLKNAGRSYSQNIPISGSWCWTRRLSVLPTTQGMPRRCWRKTAVGACSGASTQTPGHSSSLPPNSEPPLTTGAQNCHNSLDVVNSCQNAVRETSNGVY